MARIGQEEAKLIRKKLYLSYAGLAGSLAVFVGAALTFGGEILNSEFWSMLMLAFSDAEIIAQNLGDFSLSLLETFPAVSLAIILIPMFALLLSFSTYLKSIKRSHYNYI